MLYQPRSNHSQVLGDSHISNTPWAVSQPCVSGAVSSVLNSHSWEKRQMLPVSKRPKKKEILTWLKFYLLPQSCWLHCIAYPCSPSMGKCSVSTNRKPCVIHSSATSKELTCNLIHFKSRLSCRGYTDCTFLGSRSLQFTASSSTLQSERFLSDNFGIITFFPPVFTYSRIETRIFFILRIQLYSIAFSTIMAAKT